MRMTIGSFKLRLRQAARDYLSVEANGTAVVHVPLAGPSLGGKFPVLSFLFVRDVLTDISLAEV